MRLSHATPSLILGLWEKSRHKVGDHPSLSEVATAIVDSLYEEFADSLVLIRAFLTVPYEALPAHQRQFASQLAISVNLEDLLRPCTPVHTLIATRGRVDEWNHVKASRGHVAIPLLSDDFVASIPMMSRMLKDLGLPLSWVQDPGTILERSLLGSEVGCFRIADPVKAIDELGRKVIPAQDFVITHSVNSVFAVAGILFGGAVFTLIFFGQDPVEFRIARAFMPLISQLKGIMIANCSISRVFPPDEGQSLTCRNEGTLLGGGN